MTLYRTTIRAATVARIKAAETAAGDRVYPMRLRPVETSRPGNVPAIGVYTNREVMDVSPGTAPRGNTDLALVVEFVAAGADDETVAAELDDLVEVVTDALFRNAEWVRLWQRLTRVETDYEGGEQSARQTWSAKMTITGRFHQAFEPIVDADLETVSIETDMRDPAADPNVVPVGPDGRIEHVGAVTLPTGAPRAIQAGFRRVTQDGKTRVISEA